MNLIEPFIKYSKLYKKLTDPTVRTQFFDQCNERLASFKEPFMRQSSCAVSVCDYCFTDNSGTELCKNCLFPVCILKTDKEFSMYCLLSVCYWEMNMHEVSENDYTVWNARVKMAWTLHETHDKIYKVDIEQCLQCESCVSDSELVTKKFNYDLFCRRCLFPLFQINYI
ncbi:ac52-like protein [Cryptophlebia peltastica nucleopolyhedrovirus]|uniref:Ac52-like protein n=1 Tax=Cryptophlebia peltastica nucleopolyhedrovirus TaxID=2304025 RepID=A0A346RNQ5_9ABAC|nr:ac52-like protein [Cryptophlebia peltastica nucleopolyhedrovirus]AXS67702.1 ac52-like protein [Cryptophlebia peltastica nucleopolyhedrovirus]